MTGAAGSGSREAAKKFYSDGRWSEAVREYDKLIDSSNDAESLSIYYSNRSACYMHLGNGEAALADADLCKAQKPAWSKSYSRKGSALMLLQRYREAVHAFEKALELETGNKTELERNLNVARRKAGIESEYGSSNEYSSNPGIDFSNIFTQITEGFRQIVTISMLWFAAASQQQKITVGACVAVLLYKIYSWCVTPSYDGIYLDDLDYESGYGRSHYGLSWPMWFAVMGFAYVVPPKFPGIFGDYARPWFGLSFTSFMWILNMLTQGQRFGGGGGLFGGRRGRRY